MLSPFYDYTKRTLAVTLALMVTLSLPCTTDREATES